MLKELRRQTYNKLPTKKRKQISQRSPFDMSRRNNKSSAHHNYMKSISKSKSPKYTQPRKKSPNEITETRRGSKSASNNSNALSGNRKIDRTTSKKKFNTNSFLPNPSYHFSKEKSPTINSRTRKGYTNLNKKKKTKEVDEKQHLKKKVKFQTYIDNRISLNYLKGKTII